MGRSKDALLFVLEKNLRGHVLNPLWLPRMERRRRRGDAVVAAADRYFASTHIGDSVKQWPSRRLKEEGPKAFSIWLQGGQDAPETVKACWRSARKNCQLELVVLDSESVFDWIELPDFIVRKWREGRMKPAHFTDICRIELLYQYGGLWLDATDLVPAPIPSWIMDEPFFVYVTESNIFGSYAYIQNCFIRGERGNFLLEAWRSAVFDYWSREDCAIEYFTHQLILRHVVKTDRKAIEEFSRMPKVDQAPTHILWAEWADKPFDAAVFDDVCAGAAFQKTRYRGTVVPGSFADALSGMYRD